MSTTPPVGADALVPPRPSEARAKEANDHQPTTNDWTSAIGQSLPQLLKRPEITIERLLPVLRELTPEFFDPEEIRENPRESVARLSSALATNSSR